MEQKLWSPTQNQTAVDGAVGQASGVVDMAALPWVYTGKDGQVHTGKWSFETLVSFLDKDGSGTIDKAEFKKRMSQSSRTGKKQFELRGIFAAHGVDWRQVFDLIDTDSSGEIDMSELRAYLMRGGSASGGPQGGAATGSEQEAGAVEASFVASYDKHMPQPKEQFDAVVEIFLKKLRRPYY